MRDCASRRHWWWCCRSRLRSLLARCFSDSISISRVFSSFASSARSLVLASYSASLTSLSSILAISSSSAAVLAAIATCTSLIRWLSVLMTLPLSVLRWVLACLPVNPRRWMPPLLPCLAKTTSIVSGEICSDFATAIALALAGTLTSEHSTNSCSRKRAPFHGSSGSSGSCLSGRKPTLTARKMPASTKRLISSMRGDVPSGASSSRRAAPCLRRARPSIVPTMKSLRWNPSAMGLRLKFESFQPLAMMMSPMRSTL